MKMHYYHWNSSGEEMEYVGDINVNTSHVIYCCESKVKGIWMLYLVTGSTIYVDKEVKDL